MIITLRISHAIFIARLQRNGQPLAAPPYIHCILNLYKSRRGLFSKKWAEICSYYSAQLNLKWRKSKFAATSSKFVFPFSELKFDHIDFSPKFLFTCLISSSISDSRASAAFLSFMTTRLPPFTDSETDDWDFLI